MRLSARWHKRRRQQRRGKGQRPRGRVSRTGSVFWWLMPKCPNGGARRGRDREQRPACRERGAGSRRALSSPVPWGARGTGQPHTPRFGGAQEQEMGGAGGRRSLGCASIPLPGSGMGQSQDTAPSCYPMCVPRGVGARAAAGAFVAQGRWTCCGFGWAGWGSPSSPAFRLHSLVPAGPRTFGLPQVLGEAARS